MEHEPTRYELVSFKPDRLRSIRSTEVTLEKYANKLFNDDHIVSNITHWNEIYFGRGLSIPTGSSVTLVYPNGTKIPFQWGITKKLPEVTSMRLDGGGHRGTRNELARIVATKVERQWDYFATLSVGIKSIMFYNPYKDGKRERGAAGRGTFLQYFPVYIGTYLNSK